MPPPPNRRDTSTGHRVGGSGGIALVDPRERGPSPFASCRHLRTVGIHRQVTASVALAALRWSIPVNGAPRPSLHAATSEPSGYIDRSPRRWLWRHCAGRSP